MNISVGLWELAREYAIETERFDRTVCTGPIRDGSIMPFDWREVSQVSQNSIRVRRQITDLAERLGYTWADVARALAIYENSQQYRDDMLELGR